MFKKNQPHPVGFLRFKRNFPVIRKLSSLCLSENKVETGNTKTKRLQIA